MTARSILLLFIIFFAAEFLWEQILTLLNMKSVRNNRGVVPAAFRAAITPDVYAKSVDYTLSLNRFSLVTSTLSAAAVLLLILTGSMGIVETWFSGWNVHPYIRGIAFLLSLALASSLLQVPLSLYHQFVLEERFGFNRMTPRLFFADMLKGLLLSALMIIPLLAALFWFMDTTGSSWWLFAFLFVTLFQLVILVLYPLVIAPLFNKFKPLEPGSLAEKISLLADRLGFRMKGIFVMDGSRRSGHSNAYFTGLGKEKRIVLFDTLISSLTEDQVVSVLAHEIGHEKKRHVLKSMALSIVLSALVFYVLSLLFSHEPLYRAFGFSGVSYPALLTILVLGAGPFTFFLTPGFSALSRKHEYEADRFAVEAAGTAEHLAGALISLGKDNLSNLTPHPLYSFYHYSHPTLQERLRSMKAHSGE